MNILHVTLYTSPNHVHFDVCVNCDVMDGQQKSEKKREMCGLAEGEDITERRCRGVICSHSSHIFRGFTSAVCAVIISV